VWENIVAQSPPDPQTVKRNRWLALGILLLPVMVLTAASLLWVAVKNGQIDIVGSLGTHNKGTLLDPVREFASIEIYDSRTEPFDYLQQPPKWTLLIPGSASCNETCRQSLWLTRQVHTALGRRATHLGRFYLSDSWPLEAEFAAFLAAEHPGLVVLHTAPAQVSQLLPDEQSDIGDRGNYYLIDKRGFVMMAYGSQHTGKDIISDLKFLMKQVGDE
jgi:cytochrome oxidase Cu insertion factor (SCO1/SenC/PrrC family)